MTRPSWDDYFLGIAEAVAARGECVRSLVGAVLVLDNRIVATGYNGVAPGEQSCLDGACPRGASGLPRGLPYDTVGAARCIATHAEQNAVMDAVARGLIGLGDTLGEGWTVYVNKEPCEECADLLDSFCLRTVWRDLTRPSDSVESAPLDDRI